MLHKTTTSETFEGNFPVPQSNFSPTSKHSKCSPVPQIFKFYRPFPFFPLPPTPLSTSLSFPLSSPFYLHSSFPPSPPSTPLHPHFFFLPPPPLPSSSLPIHFCVPLQFPSFLTYTLKLTSLPLASGAHLRLSALHSGPTPST